MSAMEHRQLARWIAVAAVLSLASGAASATERHVYPDGSGTYPTIQAAINAAVAGDAVILHCGTYTGAGNRDIDFKGKAIVVRSETWDPACVTIDCQGLGRGFVFITDEGAASELRGVTIVNALAPGSGTSKIGGGIRCGIPGFPPFSYPHHGSPTIDSCVIQGCTATLGAAMSCTDDSAPVVENCDFIGNTTTSGLGATPMGAGLYCYQSSPQLVGCTFVDNEVPGVAGAGGGLCAEGSAPSLRYCRFSGNRANVGGGLAVNGCLDPVIEHCVFERNAAAIAGGGAYFTGSTPFPNQMSNATFYGNAALAGGGIAVVSSARLNVACTIIALSAAGEAGCCQSGGTLTLTCCDVYGNAGGDYVGCLAGQDALRSNFSAPAGFCSPAAGDFTIRAESPCAPLASPCGQLVGTEPVGCGGPLTWVVCPTEPTDFPTIQAGLDAALGGDTLELCDAVFTGDGNRDLDPLGKAVTVRSQSGDPAACIIDCQGTPAQPHRGFHLHGGEPPATRIEGLTIRGGDAQDWPGGGGILCTDGACPTIQNCVLTQNHTDEEGGGLCARAAGPNVYDCIFAGNTSVGLGGGMVVVGTIAVEIARCTFEENIAEDDGGGLAALAPVAVADCLFRLNDARGHGGGATCMLDAAGSTFTRCTFVQNSASGMSWNGGGGLSTFVGLTLSECTFDGNSATTEGGGVYAQGGATLTSCTLHAGAAPLGGGVFAAAACTLDRVIVAFGSLGEAVNGPATLTCCDLYGNAGGDWTPNVAGQLGLNGNVALDPLFCDAAGGDLTLHYDSPCAPYSPPNPQCDLVGAWPVGCGLPPGWDMDGALDAGAELVAANGALELYAGLAGHVLYVACADAGEGSDHFIFVAEPPGALRAAPWAKAGQVADWAAFLGNENDNQWSGWFDAAGPTQSATGGGSGWLEGTLDLQAELGRVPPVVFLAFAAYETWDSGQLWPNAQVPPSVNGDGHVNADEYAVFVLGRRGDLDCDGRVTFADIDPFVLALMGPDVYGAAYPECSWYLADCNADGDVTFDDIDPFIVILSGG